MADQFVAEIRIFAGNFPPTGWAFCNGQLLSISSNTALFSLLGTFYGGDGKTTFGLPNLQGSVPMHTGSSAGPGLSQRFQGEVGGEQAVTLLTSDIPSHTHVLNASSSVANRPGPVGNSIGRTVGAQPYLAPTGSPPLVAADPAALTVAGGNLPHNNMQPYLALNFIIALQGIYPPRA